MGGRRARPSGGRSGAARRGADLVVDDAGGRHRADGPEGPEQVVRRGGPLEPVHEHLREPSAGELDAVRRPGRPAVRPARVHPVALLADAPLAPAPVADPIEPRRGPAAGRPRMQRARGRARAVGDVFDRGGGVVQLEDGSLWEGAFQASRSFFAPEISQLRIPVAFKAVIPRTFRVAMR